MLSGFVTWKASATAALQNAASLVPVQAGASLAAIGVSDAVIFLGPHVTAILAAAAGALCRKFYYRISWPKSAREGAISLALAFLLARSNPAWAETAFGSGIVETMPLIVGWAIGMFSTGVVGFVEDFLRFKRGGGDK